MGLSDAELAAIVDEAAAPGKAEAVARGAAQGATLGHSDEIAGLLHALTRAPADAIYAALHGGKIKGTEEQYAEGRDESRAANAAAEKAHPYLYGGANAAGTVLTDALATVATGGAALPALAIGQGALSGAGYSDRGGTELARDVGIGTLLGAGGYGAGQVLRKAGQGLADRARSAAGRATVRAEEQAAKETAEALASAKGQLGGAAQDLNRKIEWVIRLLDEEKSGLLSPDNKAALEALRQSPAYAEIVNKAASRVVADAPGSAARVAEKEAALKAMTEGAPDAIKARTGDLLTPQKVEDLRSFAKSYAEPVLAGALGYYAADKMGLSDAAKTGVAGGAGLVFGRTRAGKALWNRLTRPAHALQAARAGEAAAEALSSAGTRLASPLARSLALRPAMSLADSRSVSDEEVEALLRELEASKEQR